MHLEKTGAQTILVLEEVVEDIERAFDLFRSDLLSSDEMMLTAFDYYNKYPPLGPVPMKVVYNSI